MSLSAPRARRSTWSARPKRQCAAGVPRLFVSLLLAGITLVPAPPPTRLRAAPAPPAAAPAPETLAVQLDLSASPVPDDAGTWTSLSNLPWTAAQTGWPAVADQLLPERDVSFSRNPLVLAGVPYAKGLGTYPFSAIAYDLQGRYRALHATLGLNDDSAPTAGAVFLVYADGALAFNSGAVHAGTAHPLDLRLDGVRTLQLVTTLPGVRLPDTDEWTPDRAATFADWADARLLQGAPDAAAAAGVSGQLDALAGARHEAIVASLGAYRQRADDERAATGTTLGIAPDALDVPDSWPAQTRAVRDAQGRLLLANRRLALAFGLGGSAHGTLTALDLSSGTLLLDSAASAIGTPGGEIALAGDTEPDGADAYAFQPVQDPVLGTGTELHVRLRVRSLPGAMVEVHLALYDDRSFFTYQVRVTRWPDQSDRKTPLPTRLDYLGAGPAGGALPVGETAHYFADASYARDGDLPDDGVWRSVRLGIGKPAAVWGTAAGGQTNGVVLSVLDTPRLPAWLVARRDPLHAAATVGISQPLPTSPEEGASEAPITPDAPLEGPRLLVEALHTADLRAGLADYRQITQALYPPAPLPDWVRYQWGSWYVYGSAIDEAKLRRQIDFIADNLSDLGPWHVIVDAGWEGIGPESTGDLGRESPQRFPHGLRALIDYAHARGVRVVLFYSALYTHDGNASGEWLAEPSLIGQHPDWFIPLTPQGAVPARYLFNYAQPDAQQYLANVLTRYVGDYDADGVKIDGLGDVEGQLIPMRERVQFAPRRWALTPVVDVYRFIAQTVWAAKPGAFIESGWVNPTAAQPYAHTFRSGDEWSTFSNDYPFPGLAQHFAYAAVQQTVLGQRANIGAIWGGRRPQEDSIGHGMNRPLADQWLGAALATGAHVSLGEDLTSFTPDELATLRELLVPLRPFSGETHTGGERFGLHPSWAATTQQTAQGPLTFLALMNDGDTPSHVDVSFAEAGLDPSAGGGPSGERAIAYDVAAAAGQRVAQSLGADLPPRTLRLYVLRRDPGVLWTTSSYEMQPFGNGWRVTVRGPANVEGRLRFFLSAAGPAGPTVLLDGRPLRRLPGGAPSGSSGSQGFTYDPASGVLTLRYAHAGLGAVHTLDILP